MHSWGSCQAHGGQAGSTAQAGWQIRGPWPASHGMLHKEQGGELSPQMTTCQWLISMKPSVWQFFKKLNTVLPFDPAVPLGYIPKRNENTFIQKLVHECSQQGYSLRSKGQNSAMCIDEWMGNKMWFIHAVEHYPAIKRTEVLIHPTTQMNFENIMLSERGQTQRPHIVWCRLYKSNQKKQIHGVRK